MRKLNVILASASVVLLSACHSTPSDDALTQYMHASVERDKLKWHLIEEAGYCIPRTSTFPRPKPGCVPIPPGEINNITWAVMNDYQVRQGGRSVAMAPAPRIPHVAPPMAPSLIRGESLPPSLASIPFGAGRVGPPIARAIAASPAARARLGF